MRILTIHQPNYLPYPGFFSKILKSNCFLILDHVKFSNEQKRNYISNKKNIIRLSLPILGSKNLPINKTKIDCRILKKHWRSIEQTYCKCQFFKENEDIEDIFFEKHETIDSINKKIIINLLKKFDYKGEIKFSSSLYGDHFLKKNELLIDACNKLQYENYLSGLGAQKYIDKLLFKENNIKILFNNYKPIIYNTIYGLNKQNMCILDVLFNLGKIQTSYLLKNDCKIIDL